MTTGGGLGKPLVDASAAIGPLKHEQVMIARIVRVNVPP
jgi:hypothetical protein